MHLGKLVPRTLKKKTLIALIIILLTFFVTGTLIAGEGSLNLIPNGQRDKTQAVMALNGQIIPFKIDPTKSFRICLSQSIDWFNYSIDDLANGIDLRSVIYNKIVPDQFKIQFVDSKLVVSALIKDSNNETIAEIVNNEWKTVDPHYQLAFWDRNYNAYAFEIIGSNNRPTFQVIMIGDNKIQIGGVFYLEDGGYIFISPQKNGDAMIYKNEMPPSNETSLTIFKYPCLTQPDNLGKMINPIYPSSNPVVEADWEIQLGYVLFYGGSILAAISLTLLPFPIAALISNSKKQQKPPQTATHYHDYYWNRNRRNRGKKKK